MGKARVGVCLGSGKLVQLLSSMHINNHTNIIRVGAGLLAMQATRFNGFTAAILSRVNPLPQGIGACAPPR